MNHSDIHQKRAGLYTPYPNSNTDTITQQLHSKHPLCYCEPRNQVESDKMVYKQLDGQEQCKTRKIRYKSWYHNPTSVHSGTCKIQDKQVNGQEQCKTQMIQ